MRRLLLHEARVHAIPGRELRDLGDALLLFDPNDPEPFWNRLEGIRWPSDPDAFDRRLAETLVLFASLGRQPHVWPAPAYDEPADLVARLLANGFRDMGDGLLMVLTDRRPAAARGAPRRLRPGGQRRTLNASSGPAGGGDASSTIVAVLLEAFDVEEGLRAGRAPETWPRSPTRPSPTTSSASTASRPRSLGGRRSTA